MNFKLIIAGADGYIGQRIQRRVQNNNNVILLSPLSNDNYKFFDLLQISKFNFNIINKSDTIILLAGISSPDLCNKQYQYSFKINVIGTIEFISCCLKKGARVLFFSSDTIYGNSKERNDENIFPTNPIGEYGNMKLLVEKYFRGEPNFKSFRLSYVFSWNDKFMIYLRECFEREITAEIYDPLIRKVVYIEDLISCIINIHKGWEKFNNQYFNICGPDYLSRVEIANYFIQNIGHLNLKIIKPDNDFFKARPPKINFNSLNSTLLLGKNFTPISEAINSEKFIAI
jgi:dTDP-4-dehydrorhamnose reductase